MPQLNELQEHFKDSSVVFLAPTFSTREKTADISKKGLFKYTILPDEKAFCTRNNITLYPTHFIIDKTGVIRFAYSGYDKDIAVKMTANIRSLLSTGRLH